MTTTTIPAQGGGAYTPTPEELAQFERLARKFRKVPVGTIRHFPGRLAEVKGPEDRDTKFGRKAQVRLGVTLDEYPGIRFFRWEGFSLNEKANLAKVYLAVLQEPVPAVKNLEWDIDGTDPDILPGRLLNRPVLVALERGEDSDERPGGVQLWLSPKNFQPVLDDEDDDEGDANNSVKAPF